MWSDPGSGIAISTTNAPEPFRYRQSGKDNGNGTSSGTEATLDDALDPTVQARDLQRQAFEQGRQQGEAQAHAASQNEVAAEREKIRIAVEKFQNERAAYFSHIE